MPRAAPVTTATLPVNGSDALTGVACGDVVFVIAVLLEEVCGPTAVDQVVRPVNETGIVGCEEGNGLGDLVRRAEAALLEVDEFVEWDGSDGLDWCCQSV